MPNREAKYIAPAIDKNSFNCPHDHCGALAVQTWHTAHGEPILEQGLPRIVRPAPLSILASDPPDNQLRTGVAPDPITGFPSLRRRSQDVDYTLENVWISRCYACGHIAIWLYDKIVWPSIGEVPLPNADLPADIRNDYNEAGRIIDDSPRGAAAILRLALQKLCVHLNAEGKNLTGQIADLVAKGLDERVQKSLDVVRVIGNNAVHPGEIDVQDNREIAAPLFGLVNMIADIMISQPNHIEEMYQGLPEGALDAIEKRDNKKPKGDAS